MDDNERLQLLKEYNFSKYRGVTSPNYIGFENARLSIMIEIHALSTKKSTSLEDRRDIETIIYSSLGYMLSKYIAHPTKDLPNKDEPDVAFLVRSEELTYTLARDVDAFIIAFHSNTEVTEASAVYKSVMSTLNEMNEINKEDISDKIIDLKNKIKGH